MKVRISSVFISCILFTLTLLAMAPSAWTNVLMAHSKFLRENPDVWFREANRVQGDLGIASLTIIVVGLIVTWTAYAKASRWAWFVMFVIVWGWAFPLIAYPILYPALRSRGLSISEWAYAAIYQSGLPRVTFEAVVIFCLMVIALLLPIRSFFLPRNAHKEAPSTKFVVCSALLVTVAAVAFLAYIHLKVYEIRDPTHFLTEPPPPPPPPYTGR